MFVECLKKPSHQMMMTDDSSAREGLIGDKEKQDERDK